MMVLARPQDKPTETHWKVTGVLALVVAIIFFWPFLGVICFAAIMAFLFYPLYSKLTKYMPTIVAAAATVVASILIVLIPIVIVVTVAIAQGFTLASNIGETFQASSTHSMKGNLESVVHGVDGVMSSISNGQAHIDLQSIRSFISDTIPVVLKSLLAVIVGFASSIPSLITFTTVYLFLFATFIINGRSTLTTIRQISPFKDTVTDLYFMRTGGMIKASMLSQLLIAFVLSVLTAFLLLLIGGGPYFFFLVIVMTLLNMIPLGSGILVYPLAVVAILLGNVAGGIWVILIYTLVICSLDNVMRPRLIPKTVQLAPALMTLSVFCGIYYFGILGVVYGPVIAIVLLTTYDTYVQYRNQQSTKRKVKGVKV